MSGVNHPDNSFSRSNQKGCQKQEGGKPVKSRPVLVNFGQSKRESLLIDKRANALHSKQLVELDADPLRPYR
jgi:hypothetical protein